MNPKRSSKHKENKSHIVLMFKVLAVPFLAFIFFYVGAEI